MILRHLVLADRADLIVNILEEYVSGRLHPGHRASLYLNWRAQARESFLRQSYLAAVEALMKLRVRRLVFLARALDEARRP